MADDPNHAWGRAADFFLFNWVGGDPAYILAGKMSNPEQIENIRKQLGVDQPYYVQLWIFIKQILTFDYGASWSTGESVSQIILTRLGPSLTLLIPLTILQTVISIILALLQVRGSLTDRMVMMLVRLECRLVFWFISLFFNMFWLINELVSSTRLER
jgi:peptide/nickel transport system permease protein